MSLIRRILAAGGLILALLTAPTAEATTCSVSAGGIAFGAYNPMGPLPLDSQGTVSYSCEGTVVASSIWIQLSAGSGGSFVTRRMAGPADSLVYNLYLDATQAIVWGDGTGGSQAYVELLPVGRASKNVPFYGRVLPLQDVAVGSYTDDVAVTILF